MMISPILPFGLGTRMEGTRLLVYHGTVDVDFCLVKTDDVGNVCLTKYYGGTGTDFARSVIQRYDGGSPLAGTSTTWLGFSLGQTVGDRKDALEPRL